MKLRTILLGSALLLATSASYAAEMITVNLQARVIAVYDDSGLLGNQVTVGDSVNGSYTYDTSVPDQENDPMYGYYPQPQGSTTFTLGSLVFETNPGASYAHAVTVHPSHYPGYYQGFFRIQSMNNKPLASGANVSYMEIDFSDFAGNAPVSEYLPATAPDVASYQQHRVYLSGDMNGNQWFSIILEIDSAQLGYNNELMVFPGNSTFLHQQRFDVALAIPPDSAVVRVQAKAGEVTLPFSYPESCALTTPLADGRAAILCADAHQQLPSGAQHVEWEVELMDGRILRNAVDWKVLQ